ncbi:MAG: twin-arginine translocase subunit TatB [Gammaproteobacteria bacterium]|nr:twin-arginine translocase subunit TatB [Gammaproteobacteria bacterium]MCG3144471.1 Sec-independent protein translocase protein TatB [Gammaproteobacteria bacterium]
MFDIGFWELVVIAVIALVVFGPEKLPQFARRAGYWIGRIRRQVNDVRSEIEREIAFDEMRRAREKMEAPLNALANDIEKATRADAPKGAALADRPAADSAPPKQS